jgi:hypothetical protein
MTKCILCGKEIEVVKETGWDKGNNAQPLAEGRCCDKCNMTKVIPARLKLQFDKDTQKGDTFLAQTEEIFNDEVFFSSLNIRDNDRLRNFQLVKKYWEAKMRSYGEDDMIGKEMMPILKEFWNKSYNESMNQSKVFVVEEDVVPLLLHTECQDGNLPFPSVFIDAKVQIKDRTYFGFHIGSYYTDKTQYKAILTAYTKYMMHNGERTKFLIPDFILLQRDNTDEDLPFRQKDYFHSKIKNFIFSFCSFINEPDVSVVLRPLNPKNNVHRIERGAMPLPEYRNVVIRGKLRIYVDKTKEWQGGTHAPASYRFWVRGFYRHFADKKRYAKLYALSDEDKRTAGFTWSEKNKDVLRVWVKPFIKGQGILIKQSWEVTE